jgi:hypothetical protein
MVRPVPAFAFAVAVGVVLPLAPPVAGAAGRFELSGRLGRTFAILSDVTEGGPAVQIDALLPAADAYSIGVALFVADMGQTTQRLLDPNNGTDLGAVGGPTRMAAGLGPELDVHPWAGRARAPLLLSGLSFAGTAGSYGVRQTLRGDVLDDDIAIGWSLAARWHVHVGGHAALGTWVQYTRVFDDQLGRYASAGLEWTWL